MMAIYRNHIVFLCLIGLALIDDTTFAFFYINHFGEATYCKSTNIFSTHKL